MIGLNYTSVMFCFLHCSCSLCGRYWGRPWGRDFPETLKLRPDLVPRVCLNPDPTQNAAYAAESLGVHVGVDIAAFRGEVERAGWKVLTVSRDGGPYAQDVAICPECAECFRRDEMLLERGRE